MDKERITAEMAFKDSSSAVIKIRRSLPDFLQSVKLKYVKLGLGYGYSCNITTVLAIFVIVPLFLRPFLQLKGLNLDHLSQLWSNLKVQPVHTMDKLTHLLVPPLFFFLLALYLAKRSKPVYLVDFACYKPEDERKISVESFLEMSEESGEFEEETLRFQRRISARAGLGDETYLSRGVMSRPPRLCMKEARAEAEAVMFGALDALFAKTGTIKNS